MKMSALKEIQLDLFSFSSSLIDQKGYVFNFSSILLSASEFLIDRMILLTAWISVNNDAREYFF